MSSNSINKVTSVLILGLILRSFVEPVAAVTPAQIPLNINVSAAKPNIMLMLDSSGSMDTGVVTPNTNGVPGDMPVSFTKYSCSNKASGGTSSASSAPNALKMVVNSSGTPQFCDNTSCSKKVNFGSKSRCFDNSKYYNVAYNNGATLAGGPYIGLKLNWYFSSNFFGPNSLNTVATSVKRIDIAKEAATDLVDSLSPETGENPRVRMGLTRYNFDNGGMLLSEIKNLDATQSAALKAQINNITASDWTPLAETLSDIGKYFATGETGNLKLHSSTSSPTSSSIDSIFSKADGTTSHSINNATGNSSLAAPILGYCQKSFVIMVSDGLPSKDREISPKLRDYTGDCGTKNICNSTPNTSNLAGVSTPLTATGTACSSFGNWGNKACQNGTKAGRAYEPDGGSDYLDDVAKALYETDLRPSLDAAKKAETGRINNLITYTIGIADPNLQQESVLKDAATAGENGFYYAEDSKALAAALDKTIADIASKISSSASVVANTARFDTSSAIFQGKFDSADWTGSLQMFNLGDSEDVNGNGVLDTGEDTNGNGKLDGGSVGASLWNAANNIPSFDDTPGRNIFTYKYDPSSTPVTKEGAAFTCANLTASQKTALGIANCTDTADQGVWLLNYIRGDWSHEQINKAPNRADSDTIRTGSATNLIFRNRTHLNANSHIVEGQDPWLLGDIVNSNPVYVSDENFNYDKLSATDGGTSYKTFVTNNASRRKMIYVGANDGMLHGFDANATGTDAGKEIFAYIPNAVFDTLNDLSSPDYGHKYSVDGSPRIGDVYFNSAWHTILIGTTGAGGKAVFALDVTDPGNFTASKVLWEISDSSSTTATDLTTDTAALRGFGNNLGYTMPQPSVVKMKDGSWAAIVANGYDSINNLAVLYIINVQTGNIIAAIDTKAGSATTPNGLSTPITVDVDGDKVVDAIYAGDLLGNMWKFDVSSATPSDWKVAYGSSTVPEPLYVACTSATSCDTTRQPITAKPQVGAAGTAQSTGVMVYFGTGKYFEDIDNNVSNAQTQTFYGIWDNGATVTKSDLVAQTITNEIEFNTFNLRATSNNSVNYPTKKGWYMNLLKPSATTSDGERVVSFALLRNGRIIFNTLVPSPPTGAAICGTTSEGTSWLMEMDALTGGRLADTATGAPWDINSDGQIDTSDLLTLSDGSHVAPSGKQSTVGVAGTPAVIGAGKLEYKYTSGSHEAQIEVTTESAPPSTTQGSRQSWRQLY